MSDRSSSVNLAKRAAAGDPKAIKELAAQTRAAERDLMKAAERLGDLGWTPGEQTTESRTWAGVTIVKVHRALKGDHFVDLLADLMHAWNAGLGANEDPEDDLDYVVEMALRHYEEDLEAAVESASRPPSRGTARKARKARTTTTVAPLTSKGAK